MKIKDLIFQNFKKECELLIANEYKRDRIWVHLNLDFELESDKEEILRFKINKLQNNFPFEYLLGFASFYSQDFFVSENVLIPRPETEILVDLAIGVARNYNITKIAEIGSGSGIISICLAQNLQDSFIISGDINDFALELSQKNKQKFGVNNVKFVKSDLFENLGSDIELLVSNPPYIQNNIELPKNVMQEPSSALFGGESGDEILKKIIDGCFERKIRFLICEMGFDQKDAISNYVENFKTKNLSFYKDLAGFDRGFFIEFDFGV